MEKVISKELVISSIINIINEKEENINYKTITYKIYSSKYSSDKKDIWHIFIDDKELTRKTNYFFTYKCKICLSESKISSIQFLRRFKNETNRCGLCKNKDEIKCNKQSDFMILRNSHKNIPKIKKSLLSFEQKKENSILLFNQKDDSFKKEYFTRHLTNYEYDRISKNIISINDGKYTQINNYEYCPIYQTNNQMLFTSILYDKNNNDIIKINHPILKCDICNNSWKAKTLEKFKNDNKILCKNCSFVNKIFNIRIYKNSNDETILYQSKLELKFIMLCNENKLLLKNGPKISYFFNNKNRTYNVDFQSKDKLIEIKDEHIWHKKEVESGKWKAKEDCVKKYCQDNNLTFLFITPINWNEQINKLSN